MGLVEQGYMDILKVISIPRKFHTVIGPLLENKTYLSIQSLQDYVFPDWQVLVAGHGGTIGVLRGHP